MSIRQKKKKNFSKQFKVNKIFFWVCQHKSNQFNPQNFVHNMILTLSPFLECLYFHHVHSCKTLYQMTTKQSQLENIFMLKHYMQQKTYSANTSYCILRNSRSKIKSNYLEWLLAVNAVLTHEKGSPILLKTKTCVLQL